MKSHFVRYKEALALKKLGFDEPCLGSFQKTKIITFIHELNLNTSEGINNSSTKLSGNECSAPLYSQAFDFLREKYKLFYSIDESMKFPAHKIEEMGNIVYNYSISNKNHEGLMRFMDSKYHIVNKITYKEAKNECLCKMIEIVKSK